MTDANTGSGPFDTDSAVDFLLKPAADITDAPAKDEVKLKETSGKEEEPSKAIQSEDVVPREDEEVEAAQEEATSEEEEETETEGSKEEAEPETQEEEEEEPEAEEEEEDTEVLYTMPDGTEATLEELKKGNLRNADYTQKTQALAEERQAFDTERQQVGQERQALAEALMMSMNMVEPQLVKGAQTDWEALRMEDAYAYADQWAEYQQAQVRWSNLQQQGQTLTQQQAHESAGKQSAYEAKEAQALHLAVPDLADPTKAKALQTQLRDYAVASGLSEKEVTGIKDHRVVVMLNKARLYDEMMSAGKTVASKKLKKAPTRVLKKGQPVTSAEKQSKARKDLRARVAQTGSVDDGVEWLLQGN
jgi:hypothetical protein